MVSNRGYTTATKVRDVLANRVHTNFSDTDIEDIINRIEGLIDTKLKIGEGGSSLTWATAKAPHWVIEMAATYGAALAVCGASPESWNTLEHLVNGQNIFAYMFGAAMAIIEEGGDVGTGDFIVTQ